MDKNLSLFFSFSLFIDYILGILDLLMRASWLHKQNCKTHKNPIHTADIKCQDFDFSSMYVSLEIELVTYCVLKCQIPPNRVRTKPHSILKLFKSPFSSYFFFEDWHTNYHKLRLYKFILEALILVFQFTLPASLRTGNTLV